MRILILLLLIPLAAFGQTARKINVECRALFPFDPLTDRYVAGSMSQVAEYVKQWRETDCVELNISYRPLLGYTIYSKLVDSTLSGRVLNYFSPFNVEDSVSKSVDFSQMPHSREFTEFFKDDIQSIKRFFATPLTTLTSELNIEKSYFGPSEFASFFHTFQLETTSAEISFFAPPAENGSLNGELYIKDIYQLFRFDNELITYEMTGLQIKNYIQDIYSRRYYRLRDENSDLVRRRTPYYLHISAAGVTYRINLTKGTVEDFSLDINKRYRVVSNSFLKNSQQAKELEIVENLGDYRIALIEWLRNVKTEHYKVIETWSLSPERWVRTISERESNN